MRRVSPLAASVFQFTPLREGRHVHRPPIPNGSIISIHAPPRGATSSTACVKSWNVFQFTPLREGRQKQRVRGAAGRTISIHAPPRGATAVTGYLHPSHTISIHAPPRGATERRSGWCCECRKFQFTPLREGRPGMVLKTLKLDISIHAPPRGATSRQGASCRRKHFNSRPSARGDSSAQSGMG